MDLCSFMTAMSFVIIWVLFDMDLWMFPLLSLPHFPAPLPRRFISTAHRRIILSLLVYKSTKDGSLKECNYWVLSKREVGFAVMSSAKSSRGIPSPPPPRSGIDMENFELEFHSRNQEGPNRAELMWTSSVNLNLPSSFSWTVRPERYLLFCKMLPLGRRACLHKIFLTNIRGPKQTLFWHM